MTEAMPLAALVARALGCTVTLRRLTGAYLCDCESGAHGGAEDPDYGGAPLLPYGEEGPAGWACTGPLIARFGIALNRVEFGGAWEAARPEKSSATALWMPTPCEAVARIVVLLGPR